MMISGPRVKTEVCIELVSHTTSSPMRYKWIKEATEKINQDGLWGWVVRLQSLQKLESQLLDWKKHCQTIQDQWQHFSKEIWKKRWRKPSVNPIVKPRPAINLQCLTATKLTNFGNGVWRGFVFRASW